MTKDEKLNRYLETLYFRGETITINIVSGDDCPICVGGQRDNLRYDKVAHDDNSETEDCLGTFKINRSISQISVKTFTSFELETISSFLTTMKKKKEGKRNVRKMICFGGLKTSDNTEFKWSTLNQGDYINQN